MICFNGEQVFDAELLSRLIISLKRGKATGVNPAGDAGDTSPNILVGGRQGEYPPNIIT